MYIVWPTTRRKPGCEASLFSKITKSFSIKSAQNDIKDDPHTIRALILFRIGSYLICLSLAHLTGDDFKDIDAFWAGFRKFAYSDKLNFNTLIDQAYGFQIRYGRKRPNSNYPRRNFIKNLMEQNESWAERLLASSVPDDAPISSPLKSAQPLSPLGFVEGKIPLVLLKHASFRLSLAEFLPQTLRENKLELVYSSNAHGKSWQTFYGACSKMKHSIMVCEVLQTGALIGLFATEPWHNSASKIYGDGGCFFFRLTPDPVCYHWRYDIDATISRTDQDGKGDTSTTTDANVKALIKSYMYGGDDFIAMGANKSGASGVRIYQYLSKGSSARALGYNNAPLVNLVEFDIGLVEVYRLILQNIN